MAGIAVQVTWLRRSLARQIKDIWRCQLDTIQDRNRRQQRVIVYIGSCLLLLTLCFLRFHLFAAPTMSQSVLQQIEVLLDQHSVKYNLLRHDPVYTSAEAAAVRGTTLSSGAKALICKCDSQQVMFVMPADRRLSGKLVRHKIGFRKTRFATRQEVLQITSLTPGCIPPFGSLFGLPTWCDPSLSENEQINFNAGAHAVSISMSYLDYVRVEQPQLANCGES